VVIPERSASRAVWVLGNVLAVNWAHCAGPCSTITIYDARGRGRTTGLDGDPQIAAIGGGRYVILGEHGSLYLVDGTGGNIVTSRELDTYPVWAYEPQVAVLTGDRIAIPRRGSEIGAVAVSVLSVLEDSFLLTGDLQVPVCATL
jgi:hypothetical protein